MEIKNWRERWKGFCSHHYFVVLLIILSLALSLFVLVNIDQVTERCSRYWQSEMIKHNCIVPNVEITPYDMDMNFTDLVKEGEGYTWKK